MNLQINPVFRERNSMADNSINNVCESLMKGMETFLSTKTVVGEPTVVGNVTIIPLMDVSFGVGAGASSKDKKNGGGGGIGGKMSPNAVLVIRADGSTKMVSVKSDDSLTKVMNFVPEMLDKFANMGKKEPTDEEVKDAAFPED